MRGLQGGGCSAGLTTMRPMTCSPVATSPCLSYGFRAVAPLVVLLPHRSRTGCAKGRPGRSGPGPQRSRPATAGSSRWPRRPVASTLPGRSPPGRDLHLHHGNRSVYLSGNRSVSDPWSADDQQPRGTVSTTYNREAPASGMSSAGSTVTSALATAVPASIATTGFDVPQTSPPSTTPARTTYVASGSISSGS